MTNSQFYRSLHVGSEDIFNPDWETVERYLRDTQTWAYDGIYTSDGISLYSGDKDTYLSVISVAETGFWVNGCGLGDRDYYSLCDLELGEEPIEFYYHVDAVQLPRYVFVSEALMLHTMQYFYETGGRDENLCWWTDDDLRALCDA